MPQVNVQAADLEAAKAVLACAQAVVASGARKLAASSVDADQVLAYDLAHSAAAVRIGQDLLRYGARGELESRITCGFIAETVWDLASKLFAREEAWGVDAKALEPARAFVAKYRAPEFVASLAERDGPRHLDSELELMQDTFRKFAETQIKPHAQEIHRRNLDVPESIIQGLAEIGTFGLSIPEAYGGFSAGGEGEYLGMVVATEELSRGSLGAGGSLVTRPEILARGLLAGGTDEQKQKWLPLLASGEVMNAVAVTEPDYGSDVASLRVTATRTADGKGFVINGVKTWCTFASRAEVLMLLARTDPDLKKTHRGLSLFVVPKARTDGHGFELDQNDAGAPKGGKMEGRPIDTIGYRGMHSYEVSFENWFVPNEGLIGGEAGLGRGFYYQMQAFENGRLQTAARAVGVMQAALEQARTYAHDRKVFGKPIAEYQLTQAKLGRMVFMTQAARQFSYAVAKLMAQGEGNLEASMVKAYVCKAAEWVAREAMQIHGGFGYAEEYDVSRYYVDARVLSIFEGADETLCLKLIAKKLAEQAG